MKTIQKKQIEADVVIDVTCDLCGKSTNVGPDTWLEHSYGTLQFSGGFYGKHDCERVNLDLCETCVFEIVARRVSGDYFADGYHVPPGKTAAEVFADL